MPKALPKTKTKSKPKIATPKVVEQKGLSEGAQTTIVVILLVLTIYFPLLGLIGVVLMWMWMKWKLWIKIVVTLPFALLVLSTLLLLVYINAYRPFQMSGDSMFPTYKNGAYVMTTIANPVQRGDVIIYKNSKSSRDFIKRVIGLPGDTVMLHDGSVFLNGKQLDESNYLSPNTKTSSGTFLKDGQSVKVPARSYFVLGDNRSFSSDSRENGFVSQKDIISAVSFCYWNCK